MPLTAKSSLRYMAELWRRKLLKIWRYASDGVWRDRRDNLGVRLLKTVNLTVKSFLSTDLQSTACALTYRLLLALVPTLALLFAIGRGFGFQNLLESQLFTYFPSQREALETAMVFVDNYLEQASEGIFVGVGVVVLLWTLISLVGAVENAFNKVWGVKHGRTLWRKITDYTAIFIILPVLMVCGSGLTVFMSAAIEDYLPFMTPLLSTILDLASVLFIWLFFTGVYMLIPNTRVKLKNAFPAGIVAGIAFQVLQSLFVNGQIYVSKYNAIYGGFAFLPLLLVWMQLVLLFTMAGALLCYSAQNVSAYTPDSDVYGISHSYRRRLAVAIMAVIAQRYKRGQSPLTPVTIERTFGIPMRLINALLNELEEMGLVSRVLPGQDNDVVAYQPARDVSALTVGEVLAAVDSFGTSGFVHDFDSTFASVNAEVSALDSVVMVTGAAKICELKISLPVGTTKSRH
jgi:membrane protein